MPEPEREPEAPAASPSPAVTAKGQPLVQVKRRKGGTPPLPRYMQKPAPEVQAPALTTAADDVPPDEPDPTYRDAPSIGRIEMTEAGRSHLEPDPEPEPEVEPAPIPDFTDAGAEPRTFDDLMGMFPIGDESGLYYIYVERRAPRSFAGYATHGVMRKIRTRITLEEFKEAYGGGDYLLVVYGPPKRKGVLDPRTHLPAPKALTKPVRFTIPWAGAGGHPPNPDVAYESEEDSMENSSGFPLPHLMTRGTPAGAKMYEAHLGAEERRELRSREDVQRSRSERRQREQTALELVTQQAERREADLRQMVRDLTQELKDAKGAKPSTDFDGLSRVLTTMNPRAQKGEIEALADGHRREVETLERRSREEVEALHRRHGEEVSRVRADARADVQRAEDRVAGIEARATQRVTDVEGKLETQAIRAREERDQAVALVRAEAQREIEHARGEGARNLEVQRVAQETLLRTERDSYERELRVRAEIAESRLTTEKARLEAEVKRLEADARKRDRDVEEFKRLAEQNKDLGRLISEAEKTARLLGLERRDADEGGASEPLDWKQMLLQAGMQAVQKLPDIISKAGDSLAAVRLASAGVNPQQQVLPPGVPMPQQMQGYAPRAMPMPRRVFAAEGSGIEPGDPPPYFGEGQQQMGGVRPMPLSPEPQHVAPPPMPVGEMVPPPVAPMPEPPPAAPAVPALAAHAPSVAPPRQAPPPAPEPQASPPPRAPDHELGTPALDPNILQGQAELEKHYQAKTPPEAIVQALVQQYGIDMVRAYQPMASADAVVGALTRAGGGSRLLSYKGKRYLKAIEEAMARALAPAA